MAISLSVSGKKDRRLQFRLALFSGRRSINTREDASQGLPCNGFEVPWQSVRHISDQSPGYCVRLNYYFQAVKMTIPAKPA
jgi:hypothetical protein